MPVKFEHSSFTVGPNDAKARRNYVSNYDSVFGIPKKAKAGKLEKFPIIVRNAARCKVCGTEVESKHCYDKVWCKCGKIAVDGGHAYLKRIGNFGDMEELSITKPWVEPVAGDVLEFLVPVKTMAKVTYDVGDRMELLKPSETNFRGIKRANCWLLACKHFPQGTVWENVNSMIRDCTVKLVRGSDV